MLTSAAFAQQVILQQQVGSQSEAVDAARSGAPRSDDPRQMIRPGNRLPSIQIQGDGIGLPQGVGEKQKQQQEDKNREATGTRNCVGGSRDGEACREKEADPVARRIDQGTERNPGAAQPLDVKVQGSAIEVPRCFNESRESIACK